jgi:hypothetical protein
MATPRELLNKIKQRTWVLMIASGGDLDYADAQRAAAKEIAAQERELKRNSVATIASAPTPEGVTPGNARQWLYDRLAEISLRLKAYIVDDEPPPQFKKHTSDPECLTTIVKRPTSDPECLVATTKRPTSDPGNLSTNDKFEPESPPPDQIVGGVIFGTAATSERIDDSEFHRSVQSPTTQNWRKSIELAEKRRSTRWVG